MIATHHAVHQVTLPVETSSRAAIESPPDLMPQRPRWVDDAIGEHHRRGNDSTAGVEVIESGPLLFVSTRVPDARALNARTLRARVADAYGAVGDALAAFNRHPIRFWNYIPDPGAPMDDGLDRYMVFNAGRFDGFARRQASASGAGAALATASGIGTIGDDLVVHCLASDAPGVAVENPRQTPAWRYSARYGPIPPCFSRATIAAIRGRRLLLVGGTASVVGEDSRHEGDVGAQLDETIRNLDALIRAAVIDPSVDDALGRLVDVRVYVERATDASAIRAGVEARCPRASRIEVAVARVCRPELLVEIEGVAEL